MCSRISATRVVAFATKWADLSTATRPSMNLPSWVAERWLNRWFSFAKSQLAVDHRTVREVVGQHLNPESRLVTDGAQHYKFFMPTPQQHESVDHSKGEYVRGDLYTNTLEGFFSILKRGLVGTYQLVSEEHLHRYLAEFDFRMNTREKLGINDILRAAVALKAGKGKRLTYRTTDSRRAHTRSSQDLLDGDRVPWRTPV
jgi:transposase-like protein